MAAEEWQWVLAFLTTGGDAPQTYDEFHKLHRVGDMYHS